jgi:hypothetical protein
MEWFVHPADDKSFYGGVLWQFFHTFNAINCFFSMHKRLKEKKTNQRKLLYDSDTSK